MTNYEYIKSLSVEEMAKEIYFADTNYCEHCKLKPCEFEDGTLGLEISLSACRNAIINWLNAERGK